jgi:ATP-binding cassette subfamily F protein 3
MQFNGIPLFDGITFTVGDQDKIGLVGRNGAGKSTLLNVLHGDIIAESGTITTSKNHTIGFLKQQLKAEYSGSVKDECKHAFIEVMKIEEELIVLQQKISEYSDFNDPHYHALCENMSELYARHEILGGNAMEANIEKVLLGLGFTHESMLKHAKELSGGWQMRLELAKLLLRKPDTLLLDEPTNHLDIDSIRWLEQYLAQYDGAVILVSHDRIFLDTITNRTIEIRGGGIEDYPCSYSKYVIERLEREEHRKKAYLAQQKEIAKTQEFIDRFRSKATLASRVQSRVKQLESKERITLDETTDKTISFAFPPAPRAPRMLFHSSDMIKKYDDKVILNHISFDIERGMRCAFVGRNGEGKSTLSRILAGIESYQGTLQIGEGLKIGYFAQQHADSLDPTKTVFETLDHVATGEVRTKIRSILGAFLFSGDSVDKKVRVLSGGERARLALAMLLLTESHVLILDEPTNHLDMSAKDILKAALQQYNGSLIIVSHDRDFLSGLVDNIFHFSQGSVKHHAMQLEEYLEKYSITSLDESRSHVQFNDNGKHQTTAQFSREEKKNQEREERKRKKRIDEIEQQIAKSEEAIAHIDLNMALEENYSNPLKMKELSQSRIDLQNTLDILFEEWEQIHSDQ